MDTVVLAAGRGERLAGVTPRWTKPLLTVNGEPMVRHVAATAHAVTGDRVIVVVSPHNKDAIAETFRGDQHVTTVLQDKPRGPGDALFWGLCATADDERTLVLMADNLVSESDVQRVATAEPFGIGVRVLNPTPDSERFTRLSGGRWVEKTRLTNEEKKHIVTAWIGPITVDPIATHVFLKNITNAGGEVGIGPHLGRFAPGAQLIHVNSVDIGTPEAVAENGIGVAR